MTSDQINAILLNVKDTVITSKVFLPAGSLAKFEKEGEVLSVTVCEDIPLFHKVSLTDINQSEAVIKYGQPIGEATELIKQGSHVHDHNITSPRKKHSAE